MENLWIEYNSEKFIFPVTRLMVNRLKGNEKVKKKEKKKKRKRYDLKG